IDLSPRWRHVAQLNRERLTDAGLPATVLPVSAELRLQAARSNDAALNEESGFTALLARLQHDAATKANRLVPHAAAAIAASVIEALATPLADLRTARAGQLQDLQHGLEHLRRQSVRWQTTLSDDIADLASDVEYDLRDRTRKIIRRVD